MYIVSPRIMTVAGEEKNKAENTDTVAKGMFSVFSPHECNTSGFMAK